jgi:hypothetical protein
MESKYEKIIELEEENLIDWTHLPEDLVFEIFCSLDLQSRNRAARCCKVRNMSPRFFDNSEMDGGLLIAENENKNIRRRKIASDPIRKFQRGGSTILF